jgi:glycosyltransferase involved in cell wall biosynthesis
MPNSPLRIAVVAPIMVNHDGISLAARDTVRIFAGNPRFEVRYFGCTCEFPEINHQLCAHAGDLLLDSFYQSADVAIFHFGIYHPLFDALLCAGPPKKIVRFHNITPARFVQPQEVRVIERSFRQLESLRHADEIWADSPTNMLELVERGFDVSRIHVIPLVVEDPAFFDLAAKQFSPVRILFVGRFSPSKGLHELVSAVAKVNSAPERLHVTLAGNTTWSSPEYLAHVRSLITRHGLEKSVHFAGRVSDKERERLFLEAHILAIPSYHEGFCRPVAEGLRTGCIPVVYDGYNLPHIAAGLGNVVRAGDIVSLASAIERISCAIPIALGDLEAPHLQLDRGPTSVNEFTKLARDHVASFDFEKVAVEMRQRLLDVTSKAKSEPIV